MSLVLREGCTELRVDGDDGIISDGSLIAGRTSYLHFEGAHMMIDHRCNSAFPHKSF